MSRPKEEVFEETKEKLKEYIDDEEITNFSDIVDEINKKLDEKATTARPRKKKVVQNEQE